MFTVFPLIREHTPTLLRNVMVTLRGVDGTVRLHNRAAPLGVEEAPTLFRLKHVFALIHLRVIRVLTRIAVSLTSVTSAVLRSTGRVRALSGRRSELTSIRRPAVRLDSRVAYRRTRVL